MNARLAIPRDRAMDKPRESVFIARVDETAEQFAVRQTDAFPERDKS